MSLYIVFTNNHRTNLDAISHVCPKYKGKSVALSLLMQHDSLILNDNMKTRNFARKSINIHISFNDVTFLSHFAKKTSEIFPINFAAIFTNTRVCNNIMYMCV